MNGRPFWRSFAPGGASARALAIATLVIFAGLGYLFLYAPLQTRLDDAEARAASLERRTAALSAAAAARRAEAAIAAPDPVTLGRATAWLNDHAPERNADEAMLELLSTLRLLAETARVDLASVTALDGARDAAVRNFTTTAEVGGLNAHVAEARIVADHAGLARFLTAIDAVSPSLHAPALEITARESNATAEARRLSVTIIVAALSRPPAE